MCAEGGPRFTSVPGKHEFCTSLGALGFNRLYDPRGRC